VQGVAQGMYVHGKVTELEPGGMWLLPPQMSQEGRGVMWGACKPGIPKQSPHWQYGRAGVWMTGLQPFLRFVRAAPPVLCRRTALLVSQLMPCGHRPSWLLWRHPNTITLNGYGGLGMMNSHHRCGTKL